MHLAFHDNNIECGMCDHNFDSPAQVIEECFHVSNESGGMSGGRTIFLMIHVDQNFVF